MMKGLKYIVMAANIVIFTALALIVPISFEANDDIVMAMIANGGYTGIPDCHLVFINVIYGAMLAGLYSLTKAVEWYTLSFAVLHILSMSVLVYCVLTMPNRAKWERILWLMVLYAFWARIIVALQFTTTAGLTSMAGCVLLLRNSHKARWIGVLFIVVASLVRITAAGLVGILMAPMILYIYRLGWRKYVPLVVMFLTVIGCRMVNNCVYDNDPEWRYYKEYNELRRQLTDNPNAYKLTPEDLPEGVDSTDYKLLLHFIPDPEQMDLPTLQRLTAIVGNVPFTTKLKNMHHLGQYAVELGILFVLLVLMILTTGNKFKHVFLILYTFFVLFLMAYVSLDGFLKNRVFLCMLLPILMTDFLLLPNTTGLKRRWGFVIIMVALCGWLGYQTNCDQIRQRHRRNGWENKQRPILDKIPDDVTLITIDAAMCMEAANPWNIWPFSFRSYALGWLTWCPLNTPIGHSYRIFLRDDVHIFTFYPLDRNVRLDLIRKQIEKNFGMSTEVEVLDVNKGYAILKLNIKS